MKTARVLLLSLAAAFGGCHKDAADQPAADQPAAAHPKVSVPVVAKRGPTADELTAGMVEAPTQGKSQLPVKIKFDVAQRPAVGQPLDINIAVMPEIDATQAQIQVAGGDGINLAPGTGPIDLPVLEAGHVYREGLKVTPAADGLLLLSLSISVKHDDATESRTFSIPLIVER